MKIAIIGTGYVGLPSGVGFAELGNDVCCIDNNISKIDLLNKGVLTLYEDGLEEMFKCNVQAGRLRFTTSMKEGVPTADLVIIAVGTPPHPVTKEADLQYIEAAASELASYLTGYTVVATKSTVPVGTGDKIEEIIRKINPKADVDVISLPEFLREGFAIHDFFAPDRIVVGTNSVRARAIIKELYAPFKNSKMLFVNRKSSETIKYASNAFLAVKLNYINEMANFCEKTGADIDEVAEGMGLDSRIGNKFLKAGPGFGGSCFPKDTHAMSF
ncbi:MAG: UDP-glucose/GDP-mannose dehydrogenase family protein, partial [Alphaproteobacteria bacterium]|nr:UDP-glucose/GDP-mannose dehydrogenase family protein [Alphaproteobacteria bacterium]